MPIDKQTIAITKYINQSRQDGTNYHEKKLAIKEAYKMFIEQYPANKSIREMIYEKYILKKD